MLFQYESGNDTIEIADNTDLGDIMITVKEDETSAYPLPTQVARILIRKEEIPNLINKLAQSLITK
jgi:hypothetical protein